jgi:hypothetical protein
VLWLVDEVEEHGSLRRGGDAMGAGTQGHYTGTAVGKDGTRH